jgi:hypothetical protein
LRRANNQTRAQKKETLANCPAVESDPDEQDVKTQQPDQKSEAPTKKVTGKKRGHPKKIHAKDIGPTPLTNAEWDCIEACAARKWSEIWKAREEEDVMKEKRKKEELEENQKKSQQK